MKYKIGDKVRHDCWNYLDLSDIGTISSIDGNYYGIDCRDKDMGELNEDLFFTPEHILEILPKDIKQPTLYDRVIESRPSLKVKLLSPDAKIPTRSDSGSNGYDLYASESMFIAVGETCIVPTGIALDLPPKTMLGMPVFKIEDRSSMAVKGLRTGGGVVDNSYKGEVKVIIHNLNNGDAKYFEIGEHKSGYRVSKGDRIAQGLIYFTGTYDIVEVDELSDSERGSNGIGSSGK